MSKSPTAELGYIHNILTFENRTYRARSTVLTISLLTRSLFGARHFSGTPLLLSLSQWNVFFRGQDEETLYFRQATARWPAGFKLRGADFRQTVKCLDAVRLR